MSADELLDLIQRFGNHCSEAGYLGSIDPDDGRFVAQSADIALAEITTEVRILYAQIAGLQEQVKGHCARIADQSDQLARLAEKKPAFEDALAERQQCHDELDRRAGQ